MPHSTNASFYWSDKHGEVAIYSQDRNRLLAMAQDPHRKAFALRFVREMRSLATGLYDEILAAGSIRDD